MCIGGYRFWIGSGKKRLWALGLGKDGFEPQRNREHGGKEKALGFG
jgi:hypothetical protein